MKEERLIDTGLALDAHEFTDLADQFAAMSEQGLRTARESGDRLGNHLSVLLEALGRVRAETVSASVVDVAPRELCATGILTP